MRYFTKGMKVLIFLAFPAIITSCGDSGEPADNNVQADTAMVADETVPADQDFYQVPAPNEMFNFLREAGGGKKDASLLHDPKAYTQYNDLRKKALNFGVYATDLLYCSSFDIGSELMNYFAVVKKMGDDLGVSSAISENDTKRLDQSVGQNDSMIAVANDIYYRTYQTLEQNEQGNVLVQMVAGGWIESLYLVTSMNPEYKEGSPVAQRVADQQLTLDNLIAFMEKYQSDAGVAQTIGQLRALQAEFAKLSVEDKGKTTVKENNGKVVLGGGQAITMTADQYKSIAAKVAEIRNNFISNNA